MLGLVRRTGARLTQRRRLATLMAQAIRPGFPGFVPAGWFVAFWNDRQTDRKAVEEMIDRVIVRLMFEPDATARKPATRTYADVV